MTYDGKQQKIGDNDTITITDENMRIKRDGKLSITSWKIDSRKSPSQLTQVIKGGKVNFTLKSIYKINMNELTICESTDLDGSRPGKFSAEKGERQCLIVLKRVGSSGKGP